MARDAGLAATGRVHTLGPLIHNPIVVQDLAASGVRWPIPSMTLKAARLSCAPMALSRNRARSERPRPRGPRCHLPVREEGASRGRAARFGGLPPHHRRRARPPRGGATGARRPRRGRRFRSRRAPHDGDRRQSRRRRADTHPDRRGAFPHWSPALLRLEQASFGSSTPSARPRRSARTAQRTRIPRRRDGRRGRQELRQHATSRRVCRDRCPATFHIEDAAELESSWFAHARVVGLTAGA